MATMYSLFFSVFSAFICAIVGTGDGSVSAELRDADLRISRGGINREIHSTPLRSAQDDEARGGQEQLRTAIIRIATNELGVREATGGNDGKQIEEYLRYTGLGKGHAWCAAFVSWCFGQAGQTQPRNPWSPALFPNTKTYWRQGKFANLQIRRSVLQADLFAIYGVSAKRVNHVGLVREARDKYLITIEGNSNNRVESRRRHLSTIYALSDWIGR